MPGRRGMGSPPVRRIGFAAVVALCLGLAFIAAADGLSPDQPLRFIELLAVIAVLGLGLSVPVIWLALRMADWRQPESEEDFERLVQRSERIAREGWDAEDADDLEPYADEDTDPYDEDDFEQLVAEALDDLPWEYRNMLETKNIAVTIRDDGRRRRAYGMYVGDTAARDTAADRIIIYRDTLLRDFGHEPKLLREQVTRTVRHEIAHHLGWDELGVRELGL